MKRTKFTIPLLSGMFSSLGLAPHLIFLLFLFLGMTETPLGFLIITYLASIFLGEYLFYKRAVQNVSFFDWLKRALHPHHPGYFLWAYLSEILFDGIFLFLAIKFNWNPLNFFLLLLGCKFLAAPVQVYLLHFYLSKNAGFLLAVPTQILCLLIGENSELFLYALILKGLLCNGIAVARSQYVAEIGSQDADA